MAVVLAVAMTSPAPARAVDLPGPLDELVDAAAVRLQTADPVAAVKWQAKGDIEDPARVNQVLAAVSAAAGARGIDSRYVNQIFKDQISATEAVEYSRFAEWKLDPASAPTDTTDLSASRRAIDALNQQMVDQIAAQWEVLQSPQCPVALGDALHNVIAARRLDGLYQQALEFATHSYCS